MRFYFPRGIRQPLMSILVLNINMFHYTCKGKQLLCSSCDKNEIIVPMTPDELNVPCNLNIYTSTQELMTAIN